MEEYCDLTGVAAILFGVKVPMSVDNKASLLRS